MAQTSTRPCTFEGCPRGQQAKGYCKTHYSQLLAGEELRAVAVRAPASRCRGAGCANPATKRGWCVEHVQRRLLAKGLQAYCDFDGCDRLPHGGGLCWAHYQQVRLGKDLVPLDRNRFPTHWSFLEKDRFRRYGVTPERLVELMAAQGGRCPGCLTAEPKGSAWALDHCHAAGAPRRVFCGNCNKAYGFAAEDPDTLMRLARLAEADRQLRLVI